MKRFAVVVVIGLLATLASALPVIAGPSASEATTVAVKMTDLKFALSKRSVAKGVVTFRVTNAGRLPHDFKIAGKKTPILAAGKSATLKVTFKKAGRYPYICAVPGHASAGMKGVLVVK